MSIKPSGDGGEYKGTLVIGAARGVVTLFNYDETFLRELGGDGHH